MVNLRNGIVPWELKKKQRLSQFVKVVIRKCLKTIDLYQCFLFFPKILERLMYDIVIKFINKHDILYNYQFGFKKGHSTYMLLAIIIDTIVEALEHHEHVMVLHLDLAKAFDTVDHKILLNKLSHYGIRGKALSWFENYLNESQPFVKYNNVQSQSKSIICGVPKGYIMGPLLFLLYINDLSSVSERLLSFMFADDTSMLIHGKDVSLLEEEMNTELCKVTTWLKLNKLSLDIAKTHSMLFSNSPKCTGRKNLIEIDGIIIETVNCTKFRGVIVDNKLTCTQHINELCNKVAKGIGIIRKFRHILNRKTLVNLYYTFIFPYLSSCNIVWGRAASVHLSIIFLLEKIYALYI